MAGGHDAAGVEPVARDTGRVGRAGPGSHTRASLGPDRGRSVARAGSPRATVGPTGRDAAVAQRDVRVVADDEVVEQLDVEQAARRERLGGQVQVVGRGRRIARRDGCGRG